MVKKSDVSDRIIAAALELAASKGWQRLSLAAIAAEAQVTLADAYAVFPTRASILVGLLTRTDRQVLAGGAADRQDSVRDRLFDVIMRRFDALAPHRQAVAEIVHDLPAEPLTLLAILPRFATSMEWMLEAAGVSSAGLRGTLRTKGLALIYLKTLRVWLDDDSADMARTMAALDQNLRRAASLARGCSLLAPMRRRSPRTAPEAPPAGEIAPDS